MPGIVFRYGQKKRSTFSTGPGAQRSRQRRALHFATGQRSVSGRRPKRDIPSSKQKAGIELCKRPTERQTSSAYGGIQSSKQRPSIGLRERPTERQTSSAYRDIQSTKQRSSIGMRERPTKRQTPSAYRGIQSTKQRSSIGLRERPTERQTPSACGGFQSAKQNNGALGGIRTHDLSLRRAALYPAELQARGAYGSVVVPRVRFELTRPYGHYVLNVARLPFRHPGTLPPSIHFKHTALR